MEIIVGVGYMLLVCSFLVKILFKTLGRFESHFGSSHDNNLFGFIANEDSDYSDTDEEDEEEESPVSLRPTLAAATHTHMTTPMQYINVVTPQTPYPPVAALRRSLRLKTKSELNLTSIEKQNRTNAAIQTQQRNQNNFRIEKITISSAPPSFFHHPSHETKLKKRSRFNSPLVVRRLVL